MLSSLSWLKFSHRVERAVVMMSDALVDVDAHGIDTAVGGLGGL